MRLVLTPAILAAASLCVIPAPIRGQIPDPPPLFASAEPLVVTLMADFARLEGDREDGAPERPATVLLEGVRAEELRLDAQLRTRGNFRLERANCHLPPLRLNLKRGQLDGTVFAGQDKLKIVGNCRPGRDPWRDLVLREYLAYRVLQAVTEASFRVRLARIEYVDTSGERDTWSDLAFFIEDEEALATRLGGTVFELEEGRNLLPTAFDPRAATRLAVFQYMIGNTDWSETKGHNVKIVATPRGALPVPYDFDFSGLVDAPYASPDPTIGISSVRERRYLGWCRPPGVAEAVLGAFREAMDETLALVEGFALLGSDGRAAVADYLRGFYDDIETDRRAGLTFLELCRNLPR